jgi:hypothetical protein
VIAASDSVIDEHGVADPEAGEEAEEQVLEEFRSFIEDVSPDDFR